MKQRSAWFLALGFGGLFPSWGQTAFLQKVAVHEAASAPLPALYTDSLPHDWKADLAQRNRDLSRRIRKAAYWKLITPRMNAAMNKVLSAYYLEMNGYFSQNKRYALTQRQYENLLRTQDDARALVEKQVPADDHPELGPLGAPADAVVDLSTRSERVMAEAEKACRQGKITKEAWAEYRGKIRAVHTRMVSFFRENKYNDITDSQNKQLLAELDALEKEIPSEPLKE